MNTAQVASPNFGLTEEKIRVAAVTYRLRGESIKYALVRNPQKIIVSQRQSGKTTALAEYIQEHHYNGVILFVHHRNMADFYAELLHANYLRKCIIAFPSANLARARGTSMPVYSDEIFQISRYASILSDWRFRGAVTSVPFTDAVPKDIQRMCVVL